MQNETTDNVTWLCPDCNTVTVDPADVTALQAAYDALRAENEQLSRILENTQKQRDDAYDARKAAQQWKPCDEDVDLKSPDGKTEFHTMYSGTGLFIDEGDVAMLPKGYAFCKLVQP